MLVDGNKIWIEIDDNQEEAKMEQIDRRDCYVCFLFVKGKIKVSLNGNWLNESKLTKMFFYCIKPLK